MIIGLARTNLQSELSKGNFELYQNVAEIRTKLSPEWIACRRFFDVKMEVTSRKFHLDLGKEMQLSTRFWILNHGYGKKMHINRATVMARHRFRRILRKAEAIRECKAMKIEYPKWQVDEFVLEPGRKTATFIKRINPRKKRV